MSGEAFAYLWQADGPRSGARGLSGDRGKARRDAAARLRSGEASEAFVEEAGTAGIGVRTLAGGYCRTGRGWRAKAGAGRRIRWALLAAERM